MGLADALDRVRDIVRSEGMSTLPAEMALRAWNYQPTSSGGRQILSALRQFELLDRAGAGKVRVSRIASQLLDPALPDRTRKDLLELCALAPRAHRKLWEEYRASLPSDGTIERFLVDDLAFEPKAAKSLCRRYRSTLAFAGMLGEPAPAARANREPTILGRPLDPAQATTSPLSGRVQPEAVPVQSAVGAPRPPGERLALPDGLLDDAALAVEVTTLETGKAVLNYPRELTTNDRAKLKRWLLSQAEQLSG
jgi:hypothetical protein